jgi:branched-chain amino acid transport system substrate-binding protein
MRYLGLILVFIATLAGAELAPAPAPITIGAIYNLTGAQSSLDVASARGAALAVQQVNQRGGVLGRPLKMDLVNGKTEPAVIGKLAQAFADDKNINIVIGLSDTNMLLAAAPILAQSHKLFVTSGATSPDLPKQVPNYLVLACYTDTMQADKMAQFALQKLAAKTVYVITDEDMDYTKLLSGYFKTAYQNAGGKIAGEQTFHHDPSSIAAQIQALKELQPAPQAIFLASGPEEAYSLIKQLRAQGFTQPILGGDSFDASDLFKKLGKQANNIYFTTHAFISSENGDDRIQQFIKDYRAMYHQAPANAFAALGYDTVKLVADAMNDAQSTDPDKVRQAIYQIKNWSAVTGKMTYNNQPVPDKPVTVIHVAHGKEMLAAQ